MYKVEKNVLVATLQYLATKPFAEVTELINALQRSREIVEEVGSGSEKAIAEKTPEDRKAEITGKTGSEK